MASSSFVTLHSKLSLHTEHLAWPSMRSMSLRAFGDDARCTGVRRARRERPRRQRDMPPRTSCTSRSSSGCTRGTRILSRASASSSSAGASCCFSVCPVGRRRRRRRRRPRAFGCAPRPSVPCARPRRSRDGGDGDGATAPSSRRAPARCGDAPSDARGRVGIRIRRHGERAARHRQYTRESLLSITREAEEESEPGTEKEKSGFVSE